MKKWFLLLLVFYAINHLKSQDLNQANLISSCQNFNKLNNNILVGSMNKSSATMLVKFQLQLINQTYFQIQKFDSNFNKFYFPIQGYNPKSIGGKNGNGYVPAGFDYFDGDKHTGHAAHDIFINDKNQNAIDDKTLKPANILAFTGGVVIAMSQNWDSTSTLRGGKYIYIYNPTLNIICYYAHCKDIMVNIGDIVKPRQVIATVGRTGLNAFKKRSPTHLHFMVLKLDTNFYPTPINSYNLLLKSKF
jgi:murein DD-endopeptidase MepM/ murein hydrolase activator NlpD